MTKFESITLQKDAGIAWLVLNRPEKLNAIDQKMTSEVIQALEDIAGDKEIRTVVLTGAGDVFCAGAGLEQGSTGPLRPGEQTPEELRQALRRGPQKVTLALHRMGMPVIASVNGIAAGGGFDWAMACDVRIGSEKTRFKAGFTSIGLFPGTGGTWLLPRLIGVAKAAELLFTDRLVDSSEAEKLGLLNMVVRHERLAAETRKLAKKIASGPPVALRLAKLQLHKEPGMDLAAALEVAAVCEAITLRSEDHREGVSAFREKRKPGFKGK